MYDLNIKSNFNYDEKIIIKVSFRDYPILNIASELVTSIFAFVFQNRILFY